MRAFSELTHVDGHAVHLALGSALVINRTRLLGANGEPIKPECWATKVDFGGGLYVLVREDLSDVLVLAQVSC